MGKRDQIQLSVLLVEDNQELRDLLQEAISAWGYDSKTAVDGIGALEKLAEDHFDIVITDIHMPRMDGQELVEHIRDINGLEDLPIVVLTTDKAPANLDKAMSKGATGWILKPHDPERLLQAIERILDAASPAEP